MSLSKEKKGIIAFGLNAVSAVAGGAILHFTEEHLSEHVANSRGIGLAFTLFALAVIAFTLMKLYERVDDLFQQQRYIVSFYPCNNTQGAVRAYKALQEIMDNLPEDGHTNVLVVNSFIEKFEQFSDEAEMSRLGYLEAIEKKIGKINYSRLLQVRDEDLYGPLSDRVAKTYKLHLANILSHQDELAEVRTTLEIVPSVYPLSFIIIETTDQNNYLLWQIEEHVPLTVPDKKSYRVAGYLIIRDPDRRVIRYFKEWFNRVASQKSRRAVDSGALLGEVGLVAQSDNP